NIRQTCTDSRIGKPADCVRVKLGLPVKALRPRPLEFIAQAKVESELAGQPESVIRVKGAVDLLTRDQCRDDGLPEEVVFHAVRVVRIAQEEISISIAGVRSNASEAREARSAECKRTASHVGLRVVITPNYQLEAELHRVLAAHERDIGSKI